MTRAQTSDLNMHRCPSLLACVVLLVSAAAVEAKVGFRQVTATHPVAVERGKTSVVTLRSNFTLDETYAVFFAKPGITMKFMETKPIAAPRGGRRSAGAPFRFQVQLAEDQAPGVYEYRVATKQAVSSCAQLLVTDYPVIMETGSENGAPATAQLVEFPVAVCGICEEFEDVDCFRFYGDAGQELTFQIFAQRVTNKIHGMVVRGPRIYLMDPILTLIGPRGQVLAQNDNFFGGDSFISAKLPVSGEYTLEVRDARYAGDQRYSYCVEIADRPFVHAVLPMAIQQGSTANVELVGDLLGDVGLIPVSADRSPTRIDLAQGRTNPLPIVVSEHVQFNEQEGNDSFAEAAAVELPVGLNGRLAKKDDIDFYRFKASKGQSFCFELESHRYGLPLDSVLELFDSNGKLLDEADDLTSHQTKDGRLLWTAPEDGEFAIAVRDLHGRGGRRFVYHLRAELAQPDFEVFGEYYYAMAAPGTHMMWFARVERLNGFEGPVAIEVEGLPDGMTATPVTIPAGMNHCGIILTAAENADIGASLARVLGRATIKAPDGSTKQITRYGRATCEQQASGGGQARWLIETQIAAVTKPLDLSRVVATPEEITLKPGETAEIDVRIERVEGYTDAVTLDMQFKYFTNVLGDQLPPGVKMSSKSKARLTGDVLAGKILLEASDKAQPIKRLPLAVLARVSITFSITTNYASNPVYLTVGE